MAEVKQYSLRIGGKETHVFTGRGARPAALKAASRGLKDSDGSIKLREHGKKKDGKWRIHVFKGSVQRVAKPANAPAWMPAQINKPTVKKLRTEKLAKV